jgi:hypothetical protein
MCLGRFYERIKMKIENGVNKVDDEELSIPNCGELATFPTGQKVSI